MRPSYVLQTKAILCLNSKQLNVPCSLRSGTSSTALDEPARCVLDFLEAKAPSGALQKGPNTQDAGPAHPQSPSTEAALKCLRELFRLCKVVASCEQQVLVYLMAHEDSS